MAQRILVIEDDEFLRQLYQELLETESYQVELAGDGADGLKKLTDGGFDLTLLDIMLPKMDGLEVLRTLNSKPPKLKNGPIILLTNLGQDSIIKEGFTLGASGYLIKSAMNPDQVLSEVNMFLGKKSG